MVYFDFSSHFFLVTQKVSDTSSVEYQNETSLCEDPELVLEFLNKDFIKDSLSEYFVSQNTKKGTQSEGCFFFQKL